MKYLAIILAILFTVILALLTGAAALRTTGITFAMVTLAFGQAGHVFITRDFGGYTNGDDGLPINADRVPDFFIGVVNTKFLYLLALGILVFIYFAAWWITESSAGRAPSRGSYEPRRCCPAMPQTRTKPPGRQRPERRCAGASYA